MLCILAYYPGDYERAYDLLNWIRELDQHLNHDLVLIHDRRCQKNDVAGILDAGKAAFKGVHDYEAKEEINGWPQGANYFFRYATTLASYQVNLKHFMWLEPDVVPMKSGWLDAIEKEYLSCGKPFMGDRVEVRLEGKDVPLHMSGVGVYENPIYRNAGECFRAFDEAWDMAARHQIVPKAHFTELIEHAWRHPKFTNPDEIRTQINPNTILFHSSKDGSLIRLLRNEQASGIGYPAQTQNERLQKGLAASSPRGSQGFGSTASRQPQGTGAREMSGVGGSSQGSAERPATQTGVVPAMQETNPSSHAVRSPSGLQPPYEDRMDLPSVSRDASQESGITCDIFIRTCEKDYPWLDHCLKSIAQHCRGFRKIWVTSPGPNPYEGFSHINWVKVKDESDVGYMAQQVTKLYADTISDADHILHVDSDVIFHHPCTPQDFLRGGKVAWYYAVYPIFYAPPGQTEQIEVHWQPITQKFMGTIVSNEYMRCLPLMIPRWLYPRLREFCHKQHGTVISDYVRMQPPRMFSEFNALGAYAYAHHWDRFYWVNTRDETPRQFSFAKQYNSTFDDIKAFLGGGELGSPATVPADVTGIKKQQQGEASEVNAAPQKIKQLPSGIWVLEGDQISGWVEESGRLDHDQYFLPMILAQFNEGDTVVDIGAHIGDHTIAYANKAGLVHAFEPNPTSFRCLGHNLDSNPRVCFYRVALGDEVGTVPLSGNNGQPGGGYIGEHMKVADVQMRRLDDYLDIRPNLIKIDVEGCELQVLKGGERTITEHKPRLVIEINRVALERQGSFPGEVFSWLRLHGYSWSVMQPNAGLTDPMYDILAVPAEKPAGASPPPPVGEVERTSSPPQVLSVGAHIAALLNYENQGIEQKKYLRKQLRKYGIIPKARKGSGAS